MTSLLNPALVARIYRAALDDNAYRLFADIIRETLELDGAGLFLERPGELPTLILTEDIAASIPDYISYYNALDPWRASRTYAVNTSYLSSEMTDERAVLRSEFYNDFARHYGMIRPMGINLDIQPGLRMSISTTRAAPSRLLEAGDKPLLEELGFHVGEATRIYLRHQAERRARATQSAAVEAVGTGLIICSASAHVIYANAAALQLHDACAGIVIEAGRKLRTLRSADAGRLDALISRASCGVPGALRLGVDDRIAVAIMSTPLELGDPDNEGRNVLLSLRRLDTSHSLEIGRLRELFGLSHAQAILCQQLASGMTFEMAADERKITVATARTHFRIVLERTGTRNLRDLLRLLANIPSMQSIHY